MEYTVKQLADLAGVTPRTLRYYDRIGLLRPGRTTQAEYRLYGPEQVDRLQQLLFYRELGFPLEEVARLLDQPDFDARAALQSHLAELEARRERLDTLILTVKKTLKCQKGELDMSDKEKFEGFKARLVEENEKKYGAEAREKYGDGEVDAANAAMMKLTPEQYREWTGLGREIQGRLEAAVRAGDDPAGEEGKAIVDLHRRWLTLSGTKYEPARHRGIAELYVCDERFTAYYDKAVPGCARFLLDAVLAHVK